MSPSPSGRARRKRCGERVRFAGKLVLGVISRARAYVYQSSLIGRGPWFESRIAHSEFAGLLERIWRAPCRKLRDGYGPASSVGPPVGWGEANFRARGSSRVRAPRDRAGGSHDDHDRQPHLRPRHVRRPRRRSRRPPCRGRLSRHARGHAVRSNADGDVIGVTIVNARGLLDRDGKITITIPERIDVSAAALAPAMSSPAASAPSAHPWHPGSPHHRRR